MPNVRGRRQHLEQRAMSTDAGLIERLRNIDGWSREDGGPSMMQDAADRLAALIAQLETTANAHGLAQDAFALLVESHQQLTVERDRLKEIIQPRLDCDGSNGIYNAKLHFDLTAEMRAALSPTAAEEAGS